jgi:hypothetical protein
LKIARYRYADSGSSRKLLVPRLTAVLDQRDLRRHCGAGAAGWMIRIPSN